MTPFSRVPGRVIEALPSLSDKAVRVAVALGAFADGQGSCFPSRDQIRERAGVRRLFSVSQAVQELVEAGVITVRHRPNASNLYAWIADAGSRQNVLPGKSAERTSRKSGKSAKCTAGKSAERTSHVNVPTEGTYSRDAAHTGAKAKRRASAETPRPNACAWFVDAAAGVGRKITVTGKVAGQCKALGKLVSEGQISAGELKDCLGLFFEDQDPFLVKAGYTIGVFTSRLDKYRQSIAESEPPPMDPTEIDRIEADVAEAESAK